MVLNGDLATQFRMNKRCTLLLLCTVCTIGCLAQRQFFSSGYAYTLSLCDNNTVQSWGNNTYGQLGRNTSKHANDIPYTIENLTNVSSIDAGLGSFCCAVTTDGHVLSWGHNFFGELGIGKTYNEKPQSDKPEYVVGGETGTEYLENVVAVSVGQTHAYALLTDGSVVSWGNNANSQLANSSLEAISYPVYVKKSTNQRLDHITMIAAGGNHGYALSDEGHVYAWGENQSGQLGCGNTETQSWPTLVIDKDGIPLSGITSIDGGMFFGLMLTNDGMVYGTGAYKGTDIDAEGSHYKTKSHAELIVGGETPYYYLEHVTEISAGFSHAMAIIEENGTNYAVSWGDNRFPNLQQNNGGQLGNGEISIKQAYTPMYMKTSAGKVSNVTHINAGCGVSMIQNYANETYENHILICGSNADGQLGFGDTFNRFFLYQLPNVCTPFDNESHEPIYTIQGTVINENNTPIQQAKIYLYKQNEQNPKDSTESNENGSFILRTTKCTGTLYAKSPNTEYSNVWAGNVTNEQQAYYITIDADILHFTITLPTVQTTIQNIVNNELWRNSEAFIYNLNGIMIEKFRMTENTCNLLKSHPKPLILVIPTKEKIYSFLIN